MATTIDLVSFSRSDRARKIARESEADAVRNANTVVAEVMEALNAQILDAGEELRQMQPPQGFGLRVADTGGQVIARFRDRAMGETAVAFDPPRAFHPARLRPPAEKRA